jgi:signal transduction histidine kinase
MATTTAPVVEARLAAHRLLVLGLTLGGGVAAAATAVNLGHSVRAPETLSVIRGLVVGSYVLVGAYTSWHRPRSRFGLLLTAIGLLYAVASLNASDESVAHTIGRVALAACVVCFVYVSLCFPHDRLGSKLERRLVLVLALTTGIAWLVVLPIVEKLPAGGPLTDCGDSCPDNAFRLLTAPRTLSSALDLAVNVVTAVLLLPVIAVLYRKARSPARLRRRLVAPLLTVFVVLAANYAVFTVLRQAGIGGTGALKIVGAVCAVAIPLALLVGQVRGRVFAATSLGQLVARVGGEPLPSARLETVLREALGDPLLRLALWDPARSGYVDVRGGGIQLPTGRPEVGVTPLVHAGRRVGALIHDAALEEASAVAEGLVATSFMLLENTQLVEALRESRARIVASAQRERLRLERNLHDGAQQRLQVVRLKLHTARARAGEGQLARELNELAENVAAAAEELRTLSHGLYPTILRERGLAEALRSISATAAVPVEVVDHGIGRCSSVVEEATYFCALEAIQNVAKHAGPGARVTVTFDGRGEALEFTIADDGPGFDPDAHARGLGLINMMHDRIGAVGGRLEMTSQAGHGTTIRGVVPGALRTDEAERQVG